jgi:hypothetical protein
MDVSEWRSIESVGGEDFCLVYGRDESNPKGQPFFAIASRYGDKWYCEPTCPDEYWQVMIAPTHWQPLPEPPQ